MTTQPVHTSRSTVSSHLRTYLPQSSTSFLFPERLVDAWQNTPTKWYPLPIAAGALLLVVLQYRKKSTAREVVVNEDGQEIVRLKGPWHVSPLLCLLTACILAVGPTHGKSAPTSSLSFSC